MSAQTLLSTLFLFTSQTKMPNEAHVNLASLFFFLLGPKPTTTKLNHVLSIFFPDSKKKKSISSSPATMANAQAPLLLELSRTCGHLASPLLSTL